MPPQLRSSMHQKAVTAAFWGFKAFLTMGEFPVTGGMEVLVGLGTQLLVEGVSAVAKRTHRALGASSSNNNSSNHNNNNNNINNNHVDAAHNHDTYAGAVRSMVYAYGSVERFQREVTNFAQFSGQLSTQLRKCGDATGGDAMATAERVYLQFVECDLDGSGDISMEEFIVFCRKMDVSKESAYAKFFRADVNGDGKISFEEWTAMMMGRVGRAKVGVNCGGHHGLKQYTARIPGMSCDFCGELIPVGSLASGCRRCNCDACSSCSGLFQPRPGAPAFEGSAACRPPSPPSAGGVVHDLKCQCSHGLEPLTAPNDMYCSWRLELVPNGGPALGCMACHVVSCMDCVAAALEVRCASALTCRGHHGLSKNRTPAPGYSCDFCRTVLAGGTTVYRCRTCKVVACVTCMWKDHRRALSSPSGAFSCPGNHQLRTMRIVGYQQRVHTCKWCLTAPSVHDHILRCGVCDVNVCGGCQASGVVAQQTRPAPAAATPLPPPPPSYGEFIWNKCNGYGGAPSPLPRVPLACAVGAQSPDPPRFSEERKLVVVQRQQAVAPHSPARARGAQASDSPRFSAEKQLVVVQKQQAFDSPPVESPFPFDSVVRVLSLEEDDPNGKLMTVIGFEPSDGGGDGDKVVLNCWGSVVRAPSFLVSKLNDACR